MRYIFGHPSSKEKGEFKTKEAALDFLHHGLPDGQAFRYRSTRLYYDIEFILFSFKGKLLAELVVAETQKPQQADLEAYKKAKIVYLLDEIRFFADNSLSAYSFGLRVNPFRTKVPDEAYAQIIARTGGFSEIRNRKQ